jgi:co-chaperonin GroES (HSP10)
MATNDGELYKCVRGYDIIGITSNVYDMNNFTVTPTADRIFVEIIDKTVSEDGVILGANAKDPRLADLTFGKIIGVGAGVKAKWVVDAIIAFPSYVGTEIRPFVSAEQPELRMIVEGDSQFHILIQ